MCARTCRRPQRRCRGDHVQPCATMPRDAQRVGRKRRDPVTDLVADDAVACSGDLVENARLPQQMKRVDHHADMNGREMLGEVERLVECGHDAPVGREDRMHRFYPQPHSAGAGFGRELNDRLGGRLAPHPDRGQSGVDTPASPSAGPTTRWCAGQRESIHQRRIPCTRGQLVVRTTAGSGSRSNGASLASSASRDRCRALQADCRPEHPGESRLVPVQPGPNRDPCSPVPTVCSTGRRQSPTTTSERSATSR